MCLFNILKILLLLFPVNNLLCLEIKHLYINSDKKDKTDNLCVKDDNLSNQIKCNNTLSNQLLSIISFKINYLYDKTSILYLGNKRWEITKDVNLIGMLSLNDINIKQLNKVNIGICGELEYKGLLSIFLLGKDKELKHIYVGASFNIMKQLDIVLSGNFEKNFVLYGDINILNLIRGELGVRKTNEEINLIARIAVIITKYIEIIIDINNIDIGIVIKNEENNKIGRVDELIRKVDVDKISETDTKITIKQQEDEIKTKSEEKSTIITDSLIETNHNETEYTNTNEDSDGVLEINEAVSNSSEPRDNETVYNASSDIAVISHKNQNLDNNNHEEIIPFRQFLQNKTSVLIFDFNRSKNNYRRVFGERIIELNDTESQTQCGISLIEELPSTCHYTFYNQNDVYFNFRLINYFHKPIINVYYGRNGLSENKSLYLDEGGIIELIKKIHNEIPDEISKGITFTKSDSKEQERLQEKFGNCLKITDDNNNEISDLKFYNTTISLRQNIEKNFIIIKVFFKEEERIILWNFDTVNNIVYLDGLISGHSIGFNQQNHEICLYREDVYFEYNELAKILLSNEDSDSAVISQKNQNLDNNNHEEIIPFRQFLQNKTSVSIFDVNRSKNNYRRVFGERIIELNDTESQTQCGISLIEELPPTCHYTFYNQNDVYFNFRLINYFHKPIINVYYGRNGLSENKSLYLDEGGIIELIKKIHNEIPDEISEGITFTKSDSKEQERLQEKFGNCLKITDDNNNEISDLKFYNTTISLRQNIEKNFIIIKVFFKEEERIILWNFDTVNNIVYLDGLISGHSIGFNQQNHEICLYKENENLQYTRLWTLLQPTN